MARSEEAAIPLVRAAFARVSGYLGFWLLLAGPDLSESAATGLTTELAADLAAGLLAAAAATWVSLRLLPPTPGRLHLAALARLALHFVWQSIVAGVDVARRAFDPRLPLKPGDLAFPTRLPPGTERAAFGAITSLMPGTLPVGTDDHDQLVYHCLDLDQPVAAGLARDEALVMRVRGGGSDRDD
ncbi:Na+/H+ antiporter subunit E [Thiocystis violascens]|uniref:Multisubunit Na+/H+ antiporter, MnhE subunit n=1 Tax=Thiocystis violascens (strain ATCC 17096 / DSM 198 / 6111) TaxID=765911 RepID=I3Y8R3_THIV6|nr:Na+/H+ antiporter subunit E [Thiocystis violascens]AFL73381.1 multisubunit Na+/H+ antiporter, MnhE subunit [Thiocystis violascens DSM 198]